MKHLDRIIDEYASADEERRLSMFLSYRALRNRFIEVDLSEYSPADAVVRHEIKGKPFSRLSRFCMGWCKIL